MIDYRNFRIALARLEAQHESHLAKRRGLSNPERERRSI